ncbi:MAG: hypothetical protein A3J24_12225 [Deltaproteobacteria bacterium RIFCSPLOWO2_02_FULL_53_8]|nr:MAG: hypothetical protein A3J24_12225 [Deltaproteobacteria bacterium RIFCSPLOWO2_02_FULL_53_8]
MSNEKMGAGSDDGQEEYVITPADFVRYEIDMFRTSYKAWQEYNDDGFLNNGFLEVFLIHFRTLHKLLHNDGACPAGEVDARQFFPSDAAFYDFKTARCQGADLDYLAEQEGRANVKFGPLTQARMDDMEAWDIHKVYDAMDKSITALTTFAPDTFPPSEHEGCSDPECEDEGCGDSGCSN